MIDVAVLIGVGVKVLSDMGVFVGVDKRGVVYAVTVAAIAVCIAEAVIVAATAS